MSKYYRDVSVTNAITGQLIRVVRIESDVPISKSDAIHEVINRNLDSSKI